MTCGWCGSPSAQRVSVNPTAVVRCNEASPFDSALRCGKPKGHLSACKPGPANAPTFLCPRCWGVYRETGERPPAVRLRAPLFNGRAVDLGKLR